MAAPVISVEQVSKKFLISHEAPERYKSLRDVIANNAKKLVGKSNRNGHLSREEFFALQDVSFDIHQGDRVGIIGRNGAGKSTLLKILSRITEPSQGRIRIRGRVASLLEVGTGFHPELTGRENIFLNGAILGMSRVEIRKKFDEIVAFAEVEKFLDTPVKRYSSGMYVRLAFAVAAHLEPEILVVDEVLAVGDAQFQKKCLGKMEDVSKNEGRTVLFVSHNMGVIAQLCNKGVMLSKGKVEYEGNIKNAIDKYIFSALEAEVYQPKPSNKSNYFSKIYTTSENGEIVSDFPFDEHIVLNFEFNLQQQVNDLVVGIGLNDKYNNRVFTVFQDVSYFSQGNGSFLGKLTLPKQLIAPNMYSWDCAIWVPGSDIYDMPRGICPIKIHDNGTDLARFEGTDYGNIILQPTWSRG
ncbi:polysaccharide ABC transporter ATP-binding protein [Paraflavitalea pollutisoli]|uniref:ABC transporter ATP-binding protein n=1 Tax=Paraflavitalea pollutisoli TaxID=3034143 RepID=UPI0023EB255F|nr:polysaccharide ABC transporter ATP-binding protein [Paraflavitalea sp. H1-2-19X]